MSMFRRVLAAAAIALVVLTFVPSHLAAEERETRTEVRTSASVLSWFSQTWSGLVAWFAGAVVPPPPTGPQPTTDGGCTIDPNGICRDGQYP
jgi:hypothetical protein